MSQTSVELTAIDQTAMTRGPARPSRMGVVVIGQSPRPTVAAEIAAIVSDDVAVELRGALDGMSRAEIAAIPPRDGPDTLFTILPSGEAVTISKAVVEEWAARAIQRFRDEGCPVTMLNCTGKFPNLAPGGLVILPSAVLHKMVEAVLPAGRLGVFSPVAAQTERIAGKWARDGVEVVGVTLQPGSDDAEVDRASAAMAERRPDLVVMDCMSYTRANKDRLRRTYAGPAILAIAAASRAVAELVS